MFSFKEYTSRFLDPSRKVKWKAGGFPYYRSKDDVIWVCLFISNDPYYGGPAPQIPKGHPDPGENPVKAAAREASEETGISTQILMKKPLKISMERFRGETGEYMMYVYGFEVDKPYRPKPNDEGHGVWVPIDWAIKNMRKDQRTFAIKLKSTLQ